MKSKRLEFQKGINVVGDKAVIQPGFLDVAENVDLRSGMPRPVKGVDPLYGVGNNIYRIFEYRGRWYYSQRWRDYQTEYINGRDRVYYTESGEAQIASAPLGVPSKIIDGLEVALGTARPNGAPSVKTTDSLTPIVSASITVTSAITSSPTAIIGNYSKNQSTSFRLAARDLNGTHTPSSPIYNQFVSDGSAIRYEWKPIKGAIGYNVFVGTKQGLEQKVTELGAGATMYTDTGIYQGTGAFATDYDAKAPYSYFYTFLREVSTIQNESGPSELSPTVETTKARQIVFDALNDGFYGQSNTQTYTAPSLTTSEDFAGTSAITSYEYNPNRVQVKVSTTTAHGLVTGDYAYFSEIGDPNWDGQILKVIADTSSATAFYVKNVHPPVATVTSGTIVSTVPITVGKLTPARTGVSLPLPTGSPTVWNGDAIYITIPGSVDPSKVFEATASSGASFYINAYTQPGATASVVKFVPHNGYIKYRNLYRTGDTDQYALVAQVPITQDRWTDGATFEYIEGTPPDSFYVEDGKTIVYDVPPQGMTGLTLHYGMLFGIDGNVVRWTPTGRPDAWPANNSVKFPYKPLALASWGQSLIVLCLDGFYRLDGNIPTQMSLSQTQVGDGCIAPHSVQKTHAGLVYLSRRGVMLFNGNTSECLTDARIMSGFFTGTSSIPVEINYMYHPTLKGYNYANLANADGVGGINSESFNLNSTEPIDGPIYNVKSFYHLGRYYLYWAKGVASGDHYQAQTCIVIDLQAEGFPITTLGMKLIDSHVSDTGQAYVLAEDCVEYPGGGGSGGDDPYFTIDVTPAYYDVIMLDAYVLPSGQQDCLFRVRIHRFNGHSAPVQLDYAAQAFNGDGFGFTVKVGSQYINYSNFDVDVWGYLTVPSSPYETFLIASVFAYGYSGTRFQTGMTISGTDGTTTVTAVPPVVNVTWQYSY